MKSAWIWLPLATLLVATSGHAATATATFAGGCFWCMEHAFDDVTGVLSTRVGFIGGSQENPTYYQVSRGGTGHAEAVEIRYDDSLISYRQLLDLFWVNIDPLDDGGQFCDRGDQYRTAIFVHNEEQRRQAEISRSALQSSGRLQGRIHTRINTASGFTEAGEYHQQYFRNHPLRYKFYRYRCGRDKRLTTLWGEERKEHRHATPATH